MCVRETLTLLTTRRQTHFPGPTQRRGENRRKIFFFNIILIFPSFNNQAALKPLFLETLLHCLLEILCIDPFTLLPTTRLTSWICIWLDMWCVCGCPAHGCLEAIPSGGEYNPEFQHQTLCCIKRETFWSNDHFWEGRMCTFSWLRGKMFSGPVQRILTSNTSVAEKARRSFPFYTQVHLSY